MIDAHNIKVIDLIWKYKSTGLALKRLDNADGCCLTVMHRELTFWWTVNDKDAAQLTIPFKHIYRMRSREELVEHLETLVAIDRVLQASK